MKLSVVTTMYCSSSYLEEFYSRLKVVVEKIAVEWEIIFVNDGSPDDSLEIAKGFLKDDPNVKIIDLSRNFGHHPAMMEGLSYASGEFIFLIDCDLEEPPECLSDFYQELEESAADVVYGAQKKREGGFINRFFGSIYYKIVNKLTGLNLTKNLLTVRLMRKKYVDALLLHNEKTFIIAGLWEISGFYQKPFFLTKLNKGNTTYDFARKFSILVNSISSFSSKPLVYVFYLGLLVLLFSVAYLGYLIVRSIFWRISVSGWTSLIFSVWFLGGLIIFCIGIIGIYLSKIFIEVKGRPRTIVKHIYQWKKGNVS